MRNGRAFSFDLGNRLGSSAGMSFAYDGHGRRTAVTYPALNGSSSGSSRLQMYSQDGKLMYGEQQAAGAEAPHELLLYVHLQDRLIAEFDAASGVLQYVHTDALGSPVLKTRDAANAPTVAGSRRVHEPFGQIDPSVLPSSVGYTGHFFDSELGMVYMQQRYYDPIAGRFLSVDPVTTNAKDGSFFGRYHYANNNPFGFVDPDGRSPCTGTRIPTGCPAGGGIANSHSGNSTQFGDGGSGDARAAAPPAGAANAPGGPYIEPTWEEIGAVADGVATAASFTPLGALLRARGLLRIRHYTNSRGLDAIQRSGVIKASDQNKVFGELARGKPLAPRDAEAAYGLKAGRGRNYIETEVPADRVRRVYNPLTKSHELQIVGDVPLQNATFQRR